MKAAPKQHLSVLIADFRQLALDCRKALAIFPGADQWSESNNLLLLSLETAIELLESGLPMPLIVARGDAEIGFQQVSELLPIEGVDYVGPLPTDVQQYVNIAAGVRSSLAT